MGRGSSRLPSERSSGRMAVRLDEAINNAATGNLNVSYAEVRAIQNNSYTIDTGTLSQGDRSLLSQMIYNDTIAGGATAGNSMRTVQNINDGKQTAINIGGLSSPNLIEFVRIANNSGKKISSSAIQDALKLLSYYSQ